MSERAPSETLRTNVPGTVMTYVVTGTPYEDARSVGGFTSRTAGRHGASARLACSAPDSHVPHVPRLRPGMRTAGQADAPDSGSIRNAV